MAGREIQRGREKVEPRKLLSVPGEDNLAGQPLIRSKEILPLMACGQTPSRLARSIRASSEFSLMNEKPEGEEENREVVQPNGDHSLYAQLGWDDVDELA